MAIGLSQERRNNLALLTFGLKLFSSFLAILTSLVDRVTKNPSIYACRRLIDRIAINPRVLLLGTERRRIAHIPAIISSILRIIVKVFAIHN